MPANHDVIGDIKVPGIGTIGHYGNADVFHFAMLNGQSATAHNSFQSPVECDICIPDGEPFEVMVIGGHHVEETVGAITVENNFSVAGSFNGNRFFGGAFLCEHIGAVEIE